MTNSTSSTATDTPDALATVAPIDIHTPISDSRVTGDALRRSLLAVLRGISASIATNGAPSLMEYYAAKGATSRGVEMVAKYANLLTSFALAEEVANVAMEASGWCTVARACDAIADALDALDVGAGEEVAP